MEPNRSGNAGRYFSVLNCASENGLSLETWGRLWVLVIPRSASKNATGFEVIAGPRSAWIVSWFRPIPWRAQVSWMNRSASVAFSRWATIQPTTYRLKTVEHDVQVEVGPLGRAEQLRDVLAPQLGGGI